MNDLNQCQFIGRLGREVELRHTTSGDACANFSIAVGESWKDKNTGEKQERTEWIRCVAWKKLAEIISEYLKKGSQVYVSGKMQTRKWQDKDGQERYTTEIVVDQMQMLGSLKERSNSAGESATASAHPASGKFEDMEDDVPF